MVKQLSGGLVLRSLAEGAPGDREALPQFFSDTFSAAGDEDGPLLGQWVAALIAGDHPATTAEDVWMVVDPQKDNRIVSSLLLIPQTWSYAGIELGVGRVELVATDAEYRRRGLIRALMNEAHARSAALGHTIQVITGIPHYYRQFGYTMAVPLGTGAVVPLDLVPKLADDQQPQYTLRPATDADIPHLMRWDAYNAPRYALSSQRSAAQWSYELHGREANPIWKLDLMMIQDSAGTPLGYMALRQRFNEWITCMGYVVGDQTSYLATFDDVLRGIQAHVAAKYGADAPRYLLIDSTHPPGLFTLVDRTFGASVRPRLYAWYMRAASPAQLIRQIAPVLEQRLVGSAAQRYSGELTINFLDLTGLRIVFENGIITDTEDTRLVNPQEQDATDARFPWYTFLNQVFGHRTHEELDDVLPEINVGKKAAVLLDALFPKMPSRLMGLA